MTDRDRLAADLHFIYCDGIGHPKRGLCHDMADRLIALGWVHATIAVRGVDDDCGPCAERGIESLVEAAPGIDWARVLHDTLHDTEHPYWCEHCDDRP